MGTGALRPANRPVTLSKWCGFGERQRWRAVPLKDGIIPYRLCTTTRIPACSLCFTLCFERLTMSLSAADIDRLAHLARLGLAPDERERLRSQLNDFFGIVEKMRAVDTSGIVPLAHPVEIMGDVALRLRDDVVSEPNQRAANQRNASALENGLFLVPRVIE